MSNRRTEWPHNQNANTRKDAIEAKNLVACSNCGSMRLSHTVCPKCGQYQGREVIEIKKDKKKNTE
jgi:ribosomal protein L32